MSNSIYKVAAFLLSVFALASSAPTPTSNTASTDCQHRPHAELHARLVTMNANNSHLFMDARIFAHSQEITPEQLSGAEPLYGETGCPTTPPPMNVIVPLHERSTCPYYYLINHDPHRFPPTLAETKCRCDSCLKNIDGVLKKTVNECVPITYSMRVLKIVDGTCVDGYYEYEPVFQLINVGCTCALRNYALSGSGTTSAPSGGDDDGPPMANK